MSDSPQNRPLVTIGIPCFNAEDTIKRAIKCALTQDWPNIEVIIVDDCSTDKSCQIIKKIISQNPRARLIIHDNNKGPGAVRSLILSEAKGEYIAFFDDDDSRGGCNNDYAKLLKRLFEAVSRCFNCFGSARRRPTLRSRTDISCAFNRPLPVPEKVRLSRIPEECD